MRKKSGVEQVLGLSVDSIKLNSNTQKQTDAVWHAQFAELTQTDSKPCYTGREF